MDRECTQCKITQTLDHFYLHQSRCKSCISAYNKHNREQRRLNLLKWRCNNPERMKEFAAKFRKKHIPILQDIVALNKAKPCVDCQKQFPPIVMDFDHLEGYQKIKDISTLVHSGCSVARLKAEIAKCEIVCANCHRLRTLKRRPPRSDNVSRFMYYYRALQDKTNALKQRPCERCKEGFHPFQMDFHHLNDKVDDVSKMIRKRRPWRVVEAEIAKCQLLCVNCHRLS